MRPKSVTDGPSCVGETWCCFWISRLGRCRRALAPHYSSLVHDKTACSAFVANGMTIEEMQRGANIVALSRLGTGG